MEASPGSARGTDQARLSRPGWIRCATALAAVALVPPASAAPPDPDAPIPHAPAGLARALTQTTSELHTAIGRWRDKTGLPPNDVTLYALYQQRIYRLLARDERLSRQILPRLSRDLATVSRDLLAAHRELYRLTPPIPARTIKVGSTPQAGVLLQYYREAEHRFQVPWNLLAAVNFVESKFGKLRSNSAAGAQGPMQFLPSTWRRYGLDGDVHDPHDAILGAANYLHASGAPGNLRRALHAYNPSGAYVDAVLRYARRISAARTMYYMLYSWQVFVKTRGGDRRVTGPGLP
jgi:membrane-bound lytic murein transglycosylase B